MTHGPADDATQHITAPLVGRDDAIHNQEAASADVVGNHLQRRMSQILLSTHGIRGGLDQALEQIGVVVAVHTLEDRSDAFQAHAGVDTRRRQRLHLPVGIAVVLHEDQVPDLHVAIPVFFRGARRAARNLGTVVVENLGTGAAGAGVAHGPEVVGRPDAGETLGI
jgi:hypothetical protein